MKLHSTAALLTFAFVCVSCTPAQKPAAEVPVPAGWTMRVSAVKGMEFALPASWVADAGVGAVRYNGDGMVLTISEAGTSAKNLDAYLAELDTQQSTGYEGQPSVKNISKERGTVGGAEAEIRKEELLAAGMQAQVAYVVKGGTAYGFMLFNDEGKAPTDKDVQMFKQMLGTVVFE